MTATLLTTTTRKGQRLSTFSASAPLALLLAAILAFSSPLLAESQEGDPALLIAPSFEHPAVSRYLPGAKRTILTPALLTKSGKITLLDENALQTPKEWDYFVKQATERSRLQLATLEPTMVRDEHGIIQMAVITTETPMTASAILLPGFLEHFSAIFGPELLITIPTQNKICVFPKLANHLPQMRGAIRDEYIISAMPASTEIFELTRAGLHAVGSFDPDDE
jgi:hypothetical protein